GWIVCEGVTETQLRRSMDNVVYVCGGKSGNMTCLSYLPMIILHHHLTPIISHKPWDLNQRSKSSAVDTCTVPVAIS
ncbi:hypothetical protein ACLOJK_027850, partial [Asimina triloba]